MSLYKQLWIAIISMMAMAFLGSFIVSNISAKAYLEEQLYLKNIDNANSLALSLSSTENNDPIMLELFLAAQYDSGHYQFIRLNDPSGKTIIERIDSNNIEDAPRWLMALFPIKAEPGIAHISNGWQQLGTLTLNSHSRFAYAELWRSTQRLLMYFIAAVLLCGIIGSWILKVITQPLNRTVDHATAIGERRFITTPEPRTLEFRAVVQAMNKLSLRVKNMLNEESEKLERWRKDMQTDKVTGLMNREPFVERFKVLLTRDDASSNGMLIMIRISHMQELNQTHGRRVIDSLLNQFGDILREEKEHTSGSFCAHINGSDFVLVAPALENARDLAQPLHDRLIKLSDEFGFDEQLDLPTVAIAYKFDDSFSDLMSNIDREISNSQASNSSNIRVVSKSTDADLHPQLKNWEKTLTEAIEQETFLLKSFSVVDKYEKLLHKEALARLPLDDGQLLSAGQFMPWLKKLNWCPKLDLIVVKLALKEAFENSGSICINLSAELLSDQKTLLSVTEEIKKYPDISSRLWLELAEPGVYLHLDGFRTLCQLLKPLGCKIGVEHVGPNVAKTGLLHDLGLDYLKIDGSFSQGIIDHNGNQIFLRGLCTIAHSIGLLAIAEQVVSKEQWEVLKELGVDGGTGRYFG